MPDALEFVVRTPHAVVLRALVRSARVPTPSGQLGLRPRGESMIVAVRAGVVVLRLDGPTHYVATAGGLLETGAAAATLCTPLAVSSTDQDEIVSVLVSMQSSPNEELEARRRLEELENLIMQELGRRPGAAPSGRGRHG